jgi:hypothetical protein
MKYLLLVLLLLQLKISFGQDYICPKEIDFGDFIVMDSSHKLTPRLQYFVHFKAIKINNKRIQFHKNKLKILYDSSIYVRGNSIFSLHPVFYHDTIIFNFSIVPSYFDSISQLGKHLKAEFTFYYREFDSYNLDSQKVLLKFRLVQKDKLFTYKLENANYYIKLKNIYGRPDSSEFFSGLINNTKDTFFIDSIKQQISGRNFFNFSIGDKDTFSFPKILPPFKRITISHKYKLLVQEKGQSIITAFGHFKNSSSLIRISDTLNTVFDGLYGVFVRCFNNASYYICSYIDDTLSLSKIIIQNYRDSLLHYKKFEIGNPDNIDYFISNNMKLPYLFLPWEGKYFEKIYVVPKNFKKYKLLVDFYFEREDGSKVKRQLIFIITTIDTPTTSIKYYDELFNKTTEVISPNPATDYIDVILKERQRLKNLYLSVKVCDVLGDIVLTHPPAPSEGGHIRLDVSGLAAGVYFVSVGGQMYKFVKM